MSSANWALVVEADARSLIAITSLLKDLGIHYKRNTTGSAVAEMALAMEPRPAVIVLDLNLPHADSFEILAALKQQRALQSVPVIAVTQEESQRLFARSLKAGCAAVLPKPVPRREFGAILTRVLSGEVVGNSSQATTR